MYQDLSGGRQEWSKDKEAYKDYATVIQTQKTFTIRQLEEKYTGNFSFLQMKYQKGMIEDYIKYISLKRKELGGHAICSVRKRFLDKTVIIESQT